MPLKFLPSDWAEIAVHENHPWYHPVPTNSIMIFLDGEPINNVVAASAKCGKVRIYKRDGRGNPVTRKRKPDVAATVMLSGKVEIFIRTDDDDDMA
jgi:hypothetical protein